MPVFGVFKSVTLLEKKKKDYLFSVQLFLPPENAPLAEARVSVEFCITESKYVGNAHFLTSSDDVLIRQKSNERILCTDLVSWLRLIAKAGPSVRDSNLVLQNKALHPSLRSGIFFQARSGVWPYLKKIWRLGKQNYLLPAGGLLWARVVSVPRGSYPTGNC